MAKSIKLEAWQLDNANTLGRSGKGISGKQKFDGGSQDFSERVKLGPPVKKFVPKQKQKRKLTVAEYLRKQGFGVTYITLRTKRRRSGETHVHEVVIKVNQFLFENQIKKFGDNVKEWYYENKREETYSALFS